jgi:hypothetical protein
MFHNSTTIHENPIIGAILGVITFDYAPKSSPFHNISQKETLTSKHLDHIISHVP